MPALFETIVLPKEGIEGLPHPDAPYYVIAQEGPFLYRNTEIGNALLKQWTTPDTLPKVGAKDGVFVWKGHVIPDWLISQAHHFFKRIYEKHKTEAEVLITKHRDTGEFRLFVPYQRVSGAGVKSIHDPTHIDRMYAVVGTLHSHCMMEAFHSGTDSGDASDMDGVHFTIGKVLNNPPEIVAMVAMGGTEFHYKPDEIAQIDWSHTMTSPAWWDGYVFTHERPAPETKPAGMTSLTQAHWDEFLGRALVTPKKWAPPTSGPVYRTYPQHSAGSYGRQWGDDRPMTSPYRGTTDSMWREWESASKQSGVTNDQINTALDIAEEYGVFSDDDWQLIKPEDVDVLEYWQAYFLARIQNVIEVLGILGVNADGDALKPAPKKQARRRLRR